MKRKEKVNMKRVTALLLTAVLALSLVACGGNKEYSEEKKEDLTEEAEVLDWSKAHDEYLENAARAEQNYDGKLVQWTGTVTKIEETSCQMTNEWHNGVPLNAIDVLMSQDDLASLNRGDEITIIGTMDIGSFTYIYDAFIVE